MRERISAHFKVEINEKYCLCDSCSGRGRVATFLLPRTKYFGGEELSTKYESYRLCFECLNKLVRSLENAMEIYDEKCAVK